VEREYLSSTPAVDDSETNQHTRGGIEKEKYKKDGRKEERRMSVSFFNDIPNGQSAHCSRSH